MNLLIGVYVAELIYEYLCLTSRHYHSNLSGLMCYSLFTIDMFDEKFSSILVVPVRDRKNHASDQLTHLTITFSRYILSLY